ncbi:hypothetical protein Tco_0158658 [Tanacetum coccineum]
MTTMTLGNQAKADIGIFRWLCTPQEGVRINNKEGKISGHVHVPSDESYEDDVVSNSSEQSSVSCKGYRQEVGIDFEGIICSVARLESDQDLHSNAARCVDPEHHAWCTDSRKLFMNSNKLHVLFCSCTPLTTPMAERPNLDEDQGGKLIDLTISGMVGSPYMMTIAGCHVHGEVLLDSSISWTSAWLVWSSKQKSLLPYSTTEAEYNRPIGCFVHHSRAPCTLISVTTSSELVERKVVEFYLVETIIPMADIFYEAALPSESAFANTTPTAWS